MTKSALQVAIESNNSGVALLEKSRHEEALEVFRASADLMYTVTQEVKSNLKLAKEDQDEEADDAAKKRVVKVERVQQKIKDIEELVDRKRRRLSAMPTESDCFLHTEGFILQHEPQNQFSCALESATILLNMALAYHLSVPQSFTADSPAVRNAISLYEMAYSVCSRLEHSTQSARVIMAALNNLAYINHECGKLAKSKTILMSLQAYIRGLEEEASCCSPCPCTKHEDDAKAYKDEKRTYLLNAVFLHKPRGAAAA